jgi:hypothetical protein
MNHKKQTSLVIIFVLAMLVVSGCAPPQATPCPTREPQSCPTASAQTLPKMSGWRSLIDGIANAIVTFEPGDKCSMKIISSVTTVLRFDVVANDNAYQNYVVWLQTLDPGKTLEDLKQLTDPINPPSWLHIKGVVVTTPLSRAYYADVEKFDATQGPIYLTCQVEGPGARKFIDHLGPLEVKALP